MILNVIRDGIGRWMGRERVYTGSSDAGKNVANYNGNYYYYSTSATRSRSGRWDRGHNWLPNWDSTVAYDTRAARHNANCSGLAPDGWQDHTPHVFGRFPKTAITFLERHPRFRRQMTWT